MRDLEQVCGAPIADRQGRGVALTPAGKRIARGIRLASAEIAAGIADLSADPDDAGRITIGAMPLCRALVLPHAIAAFVGGRPRAALDVVEGSWRELVDPLRDGRIDLMIGALRPEPPAGLTRQVDPLEVGALLMAMEDGFALHRLIDPDTTPPGAFYEAVRQLQDIVLGR